VFPENAEVPLTVLARYWAHTGQLTVFQVRRLCRRLYDLSLLAKNHLDPPPRLRLRLRSSVATCEPKPSTDGPT
jgi:hypothetical protein